MLFSELYKIMVNEFMFLGMAMAPFIPPVSVPVQKCEWEGSNRWQG